MTKLAKATFESDHKSRNGCISSAGRWEKYSFTYTYLGILYESTGGAPAKKKKTNMMLEKKKKKKKAVGEFVIFPIPGSFNYLVRSFTGRFNAKMNSACL